MPDVPSEARLTETLRALLPALAPSDAPVVLTGTVVGSGVLWTAGAAHAVPAADLPWPGLPARCSPRRQAEFQAGRACAASALRLAGCAAPGSLAPGAGGAPRWPPGWTGTISHAGGLAVAAVTRAPRRLGLDVEAEGLLSGDALLHHSLKESLFKALSADLRAPFDPARFQVTAVHARRATLRLHAPPGPWPWPELLPATWHRTRTHVATLACLAPTFSPHLPLLEAP